ncbi:MAG: Na/Pi cotransporter family protein [Candidatus Marinimicrobia bacterium]|nr:Na/Pi cotransporter family protein [Candidatus Neomarinimicrobiota bacterium]
MNAKKTFFLVVLIVCANYLVAADQPPVSAQDWFFVLIGLFGGLSMFLYGMNKMSDGLKKGAGNRMRSILSALTKNRIVGLFVGAFVTMIIQSSSATTVLLVSFVQAQLMSFIQSLGVILGADIGTTITAQLVAFKLTDYAMLMIAVGFAMTMFSKKDATKHVGEALLGFGILFFGMKFMGDTMKPLNQLEIFRNFLIGLENPWFGLLVGTILTALIQSSSAFTGIIIVLAQQDLVSLNAGIPLVLGANIGTCITAGLASINASRDAKRVALAHVLFKVCGVFLFVFWIPTFADFIQSLGSDTSRQIANAHTIFNVSLALVFLPFTAVFGRFIYKIYPEKEMEKDIKIAVWNLDESSLNMPATAIDLARNEILKMSKIMGKMLDVVIKPFTFSQPLWDKTYPQLSLVEAIEIREQKIDFLEEKVSNYLIQIGRKELSDDQANEVFAMISIANDMESIGDVIQKNILPLIAKKNALNMDFSEEGTEELKVFHVKVCKQISRLRDAFAERDPNQAQKVMSKEIKYDDLEADFRIKHLERVRRDMRESVATHEIHMELMDLLKQINVYTGNIAKTILGMSKTT